MTITSADPAVASLLEPYPDIAAAAASLGEGALQEDAVRAHVAPLFARVLERDEVYLANHSLGRPLDRTAADLQRAADLWYERMDAAWYEPGAWMDEIARFRALTARLLGLSRPDAVAPKTSAGQGLRAVLNTFEGAEPPTVVATRCEFDSVDFILRTYEKKGRARVRWVEPTQQDRGVPLIDPGQLINAMTEGCDLLVTSQVYFTTGQALPGLEQVIAAAHMAGALALIDTYHSLGVIPIEMERLGADFMIGGSYKYVRGGPGACWLAVHPRHLEDSPHPKLRTLDTGWFAKENTFQYERPDEPRLSAGGDAWLESTPPVLTAYQANAGLAFTLALGVDRLRDYSLRQQATLRAALKERGVPAFEPDDPTAFGGFSLVPTDDAPAFSDALRTKGVNTDARGGFVRFGPDVLNTDDELARAAAITADVRAER